ncbi:hypothetical protein PQI66_08070 [Corynebacterium sp. USCH3]|uniref:hypothetical protein n=1 Tax=Corynebacterium sp. USCH3 TaxID=3024840 RepID=UPI0030A7B7A4
MNENNVKYGIDVANAGDWFNDRESYWDNYGEVEDCPVCSRYYQMGSALSLYEWTRGGHGRELFTTCSEECCYAMAATHGIGADEIQGM